MSRPSFLRRTLRLGVALVTTSAVVAGAALAVQAGAGLIAERAADTPPPLAAPTTAVSVQPLLRQGGYSVPRRFIGQIEARASARLSFELGGRLEKLAFDEGDVVSEGAVVAMLDTALLEAEQDQLTASRDAILAQLAFAEKVVDRAGNLRQQGFASQERLDEAMASRDELQARLRETDSAIRSVEIRLAKSVIRAPFDARVAARPVEAGETLAAGQHVIDLVSVAAPQVRVGLPLGIEAASLLRSEILLEDTRVPATFAAFRPDIDPVTRTRTALFDIDVQDVALGQTATLILKQKVDVPGTWVPLEALSEGARGQWTLLVVDDTDVVRRADVLALHIEADRAYVQGSFVDGTRMIETGPQRVTLGQRVAIAE